MKSQLSSPLSPELFATYLIQVFTLSLALLYSQIIYSQNSINHEVAPLFPSMAEPNLIAKHQGEYQIWIGSNSNFRSHLLYPNSSQELRLKTELVSFPFTPDLNLSSLEQKRVMQVLSAALLKDLGLQKGYDLSSIYNGFNRILTTEIVEGNGGLTRYELGTVDVANEGTGLSVNNTSTLSSNFFTVPPVNANKIRVFHPHSILKHTLYLIDKASGATINEAVFIVDLTRGRAAFYPHTLNWNTPSDEAHHDFNVELFTANNQDS